MKPFTLEEIAEAYEWCALSPITGKTFCRDFTLAGCGCPMFVMACIRVKLKPNSYSKQGRSIVVDLGLTTDEFRSFVSAFDNLWMQEKTAPEWHALGLAARARFITEVAA